MEEQLIKNSKEGNLEIVKYLVEKGADIHTNNDSALLWSVYDGHLEIVKYLIIKGCDRSILNDYPETNKTIKKWEESIVKIQRACHNWLKRLSESRGSRRLPVGLEKYR